MTVQRKNLAIIAMFALISHVWGRRYDPDKLAGIFDCEDGIMEQAKGFEGCDVYIIRTRECDKDGLQECIRRDLDGTLRRDRDHCVDCNKTNLGEMAVGLAAMTAGPLSQIFINRQWSNAYTRTGEARYNAIGKYADALKEFPQTCANGFDSLLDHYTQLGINSAMNVKDAGGFFNQCGRLPQYAGYQGLFANGFGGHGNVWQGIGYSPGFLAGMTGPPFHALGGRASGRFSAHLGGSIGGSIGGSVFPGAVMPTPLTPPYVPPPYYPGPMTYPGYPSGFNAHIYAGVGTRGFMPPPPFHSGVHSGFHIGYPGTNPHSYRAASMGTVPWMDGGASVWAATGGWGNQTSTWNQRYLDGRFGYPGSHGPGNGGSHWNQWEMDRRQNRAVMERMGVVAETQRLQARGLYENYYNAGLDYYGQGMLSGGAHGSAPYRPDML